MCNVVHDPFFSNVIQDEFLYSSDIITERYNIVDVGNKFSNLDPDELTLYLVVIALSLIQFIMLLRYFLNLQNYFDKLQHEITK
jgi:hypothetical protein